MMLKKSPVVSADAYFKETRDWEINFQLRNEKSERRAWLVACAAVLVALAQGIGLSFLLPLKTVEPLIVRVDKATGIVDQLTTIADGKTNYEEVLNKYFLQKYVLYREGYSKELFEEFYNSVGIMSEPMEQQKYYESINPKNPRSPVNAYGPYAKVRIAIKSISFLKPDIGSVRYMRTVERGLDRSDVTHWVATIGFKYAGRAMKESDRAINPLGFQETDYRNDPDALQDMPPRLESGANFGVPEIPKLDPSAPAVKAK
jgi:type IV secretion system protein VirB8